MFERRKEPGTGHELRLLRRHPSGWLNVSHAILKPPSELLCLWLCRVRSMFSVVRADREEP